MSSTLQVLVMSPMASSDHACPSQVLCQIISVDAKSLMTSFSISGVAFQTSRFSTSLAWAMPYCPSVLDGSPACRGFASPAWLLSASGSWVVHELLPYQIWLPKVHLKILDVILQILAIHQLRLKLHPLLMGAPSAFYHLILPKEMHASLNTVIIA